jgi:hypothetical protein
MITVIMALFLYHLADFLHILSDVYQIIIVDCTCPFGTFGSRCQFQCHCKKHSDCKKDTVVCHSGCASPWSGRNCQQGI